MSHNYVKTSTRMLTEFINNYDHLITDMTHLFYDDHENKTIFSSLKMFNFGNKENECEYTEQYK